MLSTWYVREMFAVPEMAIVGWGTDKTRIPELALKITMMEMMVMMVMMMMMVMMTMMAMVGWGTDMTRIPKLVLKSEVH